jgi:putative transposase
VLLFYKWRAKYGGMDASLMARMKELEDKKSMAQKNVCRGAVKV